MKKDWEVKTLGEICIIERGSSPRPIKKYITNNDNGKNWIKIGDTKNIDKYIFSTKEKITKEGALKSRFVNEGDFILSNSMSFGKPYIMKTSGYIHDGWFVLRLNKTINKDYFYYSLISPLVQEQFNKLASGAIVKNIRSELVKKAKIPLPPLPEQKRIVKILDEAFISIDKAKKNAEKNLANARELFDSYLNGIFKRSICGDAKSCVSTDGWEEKKLGEVTTKIGSGATPLGGKKSYKSKGISLVRSLNVHDNKFKYKNLAFIDENQADSLSNVIVESNDILLNITGASIARCCIVPDNILPARVNQHVSIIRLIKNKVLPQYLNYFLTSKIIKDKLLLTGEKNGATRQALTKAIIEDFDIYFPSIVDQKEIVENINKISIETKRLEEIYRKKIEDLDELKKSILDKAFNGEL